jgi:hypothetical protein
LLILVSKGGSVVAASWAGTQDTSGSLQLPYLATALVAPQ